MAPKRIDEPATDAGATRDGKIVSSTATVDETPALVPAPSSATSAVLAADETRSAEVVAHPVASGTQTGRTWPDLAYLFVGKDSWHYFLALLVITLPALTTGHLRTREDAIAVGIITLVSWTLLFFIHRRESG